MEVTWPQNLNVLGPEVIRGQLGIVDLYHQPGVLGLGAQDLKTRFHGEDHLNLRTFYCSKTESYPVPHLLLELLDGPEVGLVAGAQEGLLLLAPLQDAALQLRILPLQLPHLLQVAGQPVIQELHGLLLVAIEGPLAEPVAAAHIGRDVAGPGQGGATAAVGHTGPGGAAGTVAQGGQAAAVRHGAGRGDGRTGELMEVEVDEV